ncbi:MAG: hypothetical protein OER80_01445 [Gammaproteobacteria bacterium]|nr:hypothetical protein [Gammaproteobacteria bacterium]MDH3768972.1 hypothetical protein [Gammaproteobacteria bacterium]
MKRWSHWYPHVVAATALLVGCAIYLFVRPASVYYAAGPIPVPLGGQLPSALHTLAFALLGSLMVTRHSMAIAVIVTWGAIEMLAELAQHALFPVPQTLAAYQQASTFDPADLISIIAAIYIAVLVTRITRCMT